MSPGELFGNSRQALLMWVPLSGTWFDKQSGWQTRREEKEAELFFYNHPLL
jgi:hypothetical protein